MKTDRAVHVEQVSVVLSGQATLRNMDDAKFAIDRFNPFVWHAGGIIRVFPTECQNASPSCISAGIEGLSFLTPSMDVRFVVESKLPVHVVRIEANP